MGGFVEDVIGISRDIDEAILGKKTAGMVYGARPTARPTAIAKGKGPVPTTVLAGERADSIADRLKKRKRYRTAMGGGYGELSLGTAGLLGV